MPDILKSVFSFFIKFFEQFPDLVNSNYFWVYLSFFSSISGLLIYFFS